MNPQVQQFVEQGQAYFQQHTGDPVLSQKMALGALEQAPNVQASSLAYFDIFWVSAVLGVALVVLVLLMRRSVAEKGAHIGAE